MAPQRVRSFGALPTFGSIGAIPSEMRVGSEGRDPAHTATANAPAPRSAGAFFARAAGRYGTSTARPWILPWCRSSNACTASSSE